MSNSDLFCKIHIELFLRYGEIAKTAQDAAEDPFSKDMRLSLENLTWMSVQCIAHIDTWPEDKIGRWLGFIQGCLAMRGLIDVDAEREFTRPMFHSILAEKGVTPPESQERSPG